MMCLLSHIMVRAAIFVLVLLLRAVLHTIQLAHHSASTLQTDYFCSAEPIDTLSLSLSVHSLSILSAQHTDIDTSIQINADARHYHAHSRLHHKNNEAQSARTVRNARKHSISNSVVYIAALAKTRQSRHSA